MTYTTQGASYNSNSTGYTNNVQRNYTPPKNLGDIANYEFPNKIPIYNDWRKYFEKRNNLRYN